MKLITHQLNPLHSGSLFIESNNQTITTSYQDTTKYNVITVTKLKSQKDSVEIID